MFGDDPGNAILLNGVLPTANREIGVPGIYPQIPNSSSESRLDSLRLTRRWHVRARSGALKHQFAFARVSREPRGALEFRAGLAKSP